MSAVLLLYESNVGLIPPAHLVRALALVAAALAALHGLVWLRFRDRRRASLASVMLVGLVCWPKPLVAAFHLVSEGGLPERLAIVVAAVGLCLPLVLPVWWLERRPPGDPLVPRLWGTLTVMTGTFFVLTLAKVLWISASDFARPLGLATLTEDPVGRLPAEPPDVYWIVCDAYNRDDVLRTRFGFDNGPFLRALEARGFRVAPDAAANYVTTQPSMGSALNWDHLASDPDRPVDSINQYVAPFTSLMRDNRTVRFFRRLGYHTTVLSSGFFAFETWDVDETRSTFWTSFPHLMIRASLFGQFSAEWQRQTHYGVVSRALDGLRPPAPGAPPRFTMAHVFLPHPPFVMGTDGAYQASGNFRYGLLDLGRSLDYQFGEGWYFDRYNAQLTGLNKRLLARLDEILASPRPAVILLHGDHGSGSQESLDPGSRDDWERFAIFSSVRLPGGTPPIPPDLGPVNYMRFVARHVFDVDLPALPQRSYKTDGMYNFEFRPIPPEQLRRRTQAEGPP